MRQEIFPARRIFFAGNKVTFTLHGLDPARSGRAIVRTNLGRGAVRRAEIISATEKNHSIPGLDWGDIELVKSGESASITLGLPEVGIFEAKCLFIPDDGGPIVWAEGENFFLKVESPASVCGNSMYSAFVRQFGATAEMAQSPSPDAAEKGLEERGYTVIPPSGTFRQLISRLDHIFGTLGCRILQLLPVHPLPTQYGKMGRYGSPFASLDYFNVDPALADFDPAATPMEQFGELIDAVHARRGRIFMDIPVNHTGWASKLQSEHPEYFVRDARGKFDNPGAWGVVWADLCRLNYSDPQVHDLMAEVFLFWCRRGVDGFRCDAGYMVPETAWNYIVARVRSEFPDTVFMLEGLGGPTAVQERLLSVSGLDWAYSELFQNYSRDEISAYYPYMSRISRNFGTLVSFAETHDNLRLAATSPTYARLRFLVCGLLALDGAFGFANGAEFFATEKIDVHGCGALNFGAEPNLNELIAKLNWLFTHADAFGAGARAELIQTGPGNVLALRRYGAGGGTALVLINLDCQNAGTVYFPKFDIAPAGRDVLSGREVNLADAGQLWSFTLAPGDGVCLISDPVDDRVGEPEKLLRQRAAAMAQRAAFRAGNLVSCAAADAELLLRDPVGFVAAVSGQEPVPVVIWRDADHDEHREVPLPPGCWLLVRSPHRFHIQLADGDRVLAAAESLPEAAGGEFALFYLPENRRMEETRLTIDLAVFDGGSRARRKRGTILQLSARINENIPLSFSGNQCSGKRFFAAGSNGAYTFFPADWSSPKSKYEALFAVNPDPRFPVDRRIVFANFRAWLVVNDFSQEIDARSLLKFTTGYERRGQWEFLIPAGQGRRVRLIANMELSPDGEAFRLAFRRSETDDDPQMLENEIKAKLIVRVEVENRVNHEVTKAYAGAEKALPAAVAPHADGFDFYGSHFSVDSGRFIAEGEWHYMNFLEWESRYGQEANTDRYSPGYFQAELGGGSGMTLTVSTSGKAVEFTQAPLADRISLRGLGKAALRPYVVKRDELNTVIAGYPWFLDWGRDTLIVLRGMIQCGMTAEAAPIIEAFARFERNGTIPNMIRGNDDANRDTSDAPLYLVLAVRDYIRKTGNRRFLRRDCGGRTLSEILHSILDNYRRGTPNGIVMDPESKLIFSPVHFTWMDTNYPAGTPREGYPIEIQCLWYAALEFLGETELAAEVSASIEKYFFPAGQEFAADCLHGGAGTPAACAVADDHLRPNALLAITLGAVKTPDKLRKLLLAESALLVPGGIRTLADRPVKYELPIDFHGQRLNDPARPYRGSYSGPEDTSRKVAYHNGTVWGWPFPAYCEALYRLGGAAARKRALALLLSARKYFISGAVGQLPEVADGDAPHRPGGCLAQAWSVSEFFRVYELLTEN